MTPLQLLKKIQSKNYYHMNKIINRNVNRFFRFISPFLCIFALVIIVLYISNNTYTYKPQEPENIEILSTKLLELHKEKDEVRTNIDDKYVAYNVKGKFDVYNCKNEKINFFLHGKETDFGNVIDSTVLESLNFDKPDEIPIIMKDCLKFLCEYKFSDLKEYEPFYFKFEIGLKNKEGETVEWPKDFPNLGDYFAYEYSNRFFFYIDGKYYKRVLEFCEKNRHKNIKYRGVAREIYYNPIIIYPHEDLFNYNQ